MAKVCVWKVGDGSKIDNKRKPQFIGNLDGKIDGVIVNTALGPLHPVDDTLAFGQGSAASANGDPWIRLKFCEGRG